MHEHEWKRVPPVVTPIGWPEAERFPTYNAVCETCGKKAWLHWASVRRYEVDDEQARWDEDEASRDRSEGYEHTEDVP